SGVHGASGKHRGVAAKTRRRGVAILAAREASRAISRRRELRDGRTRIMTTQTSSAAQAQTYRASCFCGALQLTVTGEPAAMGYCHCESCRQWSAGPVNAFTLWKPEAVRITRGADKIGTYNKTPKSYRKWCTVCGGHLLTEHPQWSLVDVYAAVIPD